MLALLAAGHAVRTTVRDLNKEPSVRAMLRAGGAPENAELTVWQADLQQDAGWREAVEGCDYVLHVASPTLTSVPRNDDEMVVPARDAGVKRVVLTFAFGAVGMGHPERSRVFTEADWTNVDGGVAPYQKSKTPRPIEDTIADTAESLLALKDAGAPDARQVVPG